MAGRAPAVAFTPDFANTAEALRQGTPHVYKKTESRELRLWVFQPKDPNESPRPAILLIHGGSWEKGGGSALAPQAVYFASRGIVGITIEYRLIGRDKIKGPQDCLADAKDAIAWVRAHAGELGIDPEKIVASGGSAGGHLAAALGLENAALRPRALVLFCPVYDLIEGWKQGAEHALKGGLDPDEFSPARHVKAGFPPTLVLSGATDMISPPAIHRAFVERMKQAGNRAEFVEFPGVGHSFFNFGKDGGANFFKSLEDADQFLVSLGLLEPVP